jgi:phosphatidylglycerophosphate synthase
MYATAAGRGSAEPRKCGARRRVRIRSEFDRVTAAKGLRFNRPLATMIPGANGAHEGGSVIRSADVNKAWTIPNALSGLRVVIGPLMLIMAVAGEPLSFLCLLGVSLATDFLDGLLARALRERSRLGARLDTWGDVSTFIATGLGGWLLWPDLIRREAPFMGAAAASLGVSGFAGLLKYRRLPSYHTWSAKFSTAFIGIAALLFFGGVSPWPFRVAVIALACSAAEQTAITVVLPKWRPDIRSLRHARKLRRECQMRAGPRSAPNAP